MIFFVKLFLDDLRIWAKPGYLKEFVSQDAAMKRLAPAIRPSFVLKFNGSENGGTGTTLRLAWSRS